MLKKFFFMISFIPIILFSNPEDDNTLVTWTGGNITVGEYKDFVIQEGFKNDSSKIKNISMKKKNELLELYINIRIIEYLGDSLRLDTMKTIQDNYRERIYKIAYSKHLFIDSVQNKAVSEEMIRDAYEDMKTEYNISHILLNEKEHALEIYNELQKNPSEFKNSAETFSIDNISAKKGGSLGWSTITNFIDKFADNITILNKGEISQPFKTKYGWHIALINSTRPNPNLKNYTFEKDRIKKLLLQKNTPQFRKAKKEFRQFLLSKYKVFIDSTPLEAFLNKFELLYHNNPDNALDKTNYNSDGIISYFKNDTLTINGILEKFSANYNFAKNSGRELPVMSENFIYDEIFLKHIYTIRKLVTEDLGYTKLPEVISNAEKMILFDYKDILAGETASREDQEKWFKARHREFNVKINHTVLEKVFYNPGQLK